MSKKQTITIEGNEIVVLRQKTEDYISLTDMARVKNAEATGLVISHWLSTRYALDYLGIFERLNNPDFNVTEFGNIRNEANQIARTQMQSLIDNTVMQQLRQLPGAEDLPQIPSL